MLYAGLIALICVEAFVKNRWADRSRELGAMPIPTKPDPYEIAYLRGRENEVTRLVVFDLIRRGYLHVREAKRSFGRGVETLIERSPDHPEVERLSQTEAAAFR